MIDLKQVMYFLADDHYTHVVYTSGVTFMVPFGLARIEELISQISITNENCPAFKRLGRSHIVNLECIIQISTSKQMLILADLRGERKALHLSKAVIRNLIDLLG